MHTLKFYIKDNFLPIRKSAFFVRCTSVFLVLMIAFLLFPSYGYSQIRTKVKGEIINVNHHLRVAFVDIGRRDLSRGDVVKVQIDYQTAVHMEVLESSAVISKIGIGPTVKRYFNSTASDFEQIKIGNAVGRIKSDSFGPRDTGKRFQQEQMPADDVSFEAEKNVSEIEQFKNRSGIVIQEHSETGKESQSCRTDAIACMEKNKRLENKLLMLRQKLQYMQELIDKNAQK